MKNWKQERNYRPIRDKAGNVTGGVITVDGREVEVSAEVYDAFAKTERQDRYVEEQYEKGKLVSLEYLRDNGVPLDQICSEIVPNAEEEVIRRYNQAQLREILVPVLNALSEQDREIIQALYFDEISEREYAKKIGVRQRAVQYRRNKVLREIRRTIFE